MTDVGQITYSLREGSREIFDRQSELGTQELQDLVEVAARIAVILQRADAANERAAA